MDDYFRVVARCSSTAELWTLYTGMLHERGYGALMAMHMPGAPLRPGTVPLMIVEGYPDGWFEKYREESLFEYDPVVLHAAQKEQPFQWSELQSLRILTPRQKDFLFGSLIGAVGDGVAIPTFGPNNRNGLATIAFGRREAVMNEGEIVLLQSMAQAGHLRVCELIPVPTRHQLPLSPREQEILQWVVQGKSNSVIAEIIDISVNTVDTYLRRIYEKLGVTDRVSAAVTGVLSGLVSPQRTPLR